MKMKTFKLNDKEIDLIRRSLFLFQRDCKFDSITYARNSDLEHLSTCVDTLSEISFLLHQIDF